ncbi:E3 ubiquitin-protein ligase RNF182 isoform X2 [Anolis carolinensis]|uniref:E3 ubiquitin-protein ligase RNF182 isoform X2 n=1 Tax=Anolis carolinensis TaxID=28377 RepID=UPI002F2B598A
MGGGQVSNPRWKIKGESHSLSHKRKAMAVCSINWAYGYRGALSLNGGRGPSSTTATSWLVVEEATEASAARFHGDGAPPARQPQSPAAPGRAPHAKQSAASEERAGETEGRKARREEGRQEAPGGTQASIMNIFATQKLLGWYV